MSKPLEPRRPIPGDLIQIWDHMAVRNDDPMLDLLRIHGHGLHGIVIGETTKKQKPGIEEGNVFRVLTMEGEHMHVHVHNMKVIK